MKNLLKVTLLVVAFVTLSFVSFEKETITIVIDAGHGGHDLGADQNDFYEKDLANSISKKINELNIDKNIKIHFTREDDSFIELQKRVDFTNAIKPDLLISLHVNKNKNTTTNGFEVFVSDKSIAYEKSNELAQKLVMNFEKSTPLKNRGVRTAPFSVLKKSEVPAILIEMGFISNENDRKYITSSEGQTQIAQTILNFVSDLK
ncbi:N-acetylmuramoyl-L-alanine amidase family protein [Flavobacterium sp. RSB2_4_14]|uniref:N-acetylmuramoyl-L-alanine amidase family protein n=1 Tax=Flavobacterium sp. RSB2_4_14 TaxID=3447665 RepID=UPI003F337211